MEGLLDVSRAARLAGVTSIEIHRHIASGELVTVEGKIQITDLMRIYPDVGDRRSGMVELVSQIRDDAIIKGMRLREGPTPKELAIELQKVRKEAAHYKELSDSFRRIILDLRGMLLNVQEQSDDRHKPRLEAVVQWLSQKIKRYL